MILEKAVVVFIGLEIGTALISNTLYTIYTVAFLLGMGRFTAATSAFFGYVRLAALHKASLGLFGQNHIWALYCQDPPSEEKPLTGVEQAKQI